MDTETKKSMEQLKYSKYMKGFTFQVTPEQYEKLMNWKKEGYSIAKCLRMLVDDAPFSFESF